MGVWSWLQKKFSKMKAEKEPEEFEFGCEDLTKDWFDEISDMEEPEEKIKCDENDFFDNEQDSVEPDSKPDKARTGGIWDWDSEDYWAYGESERSLLEMAHKDIQKDNVSHPKSRKESVLQALRERQAKIKEQEQTVTKEKSRTHKKGEVSL